MAKVKKSEIEPAYGWKDLSGVVHIFVLICFLFLGVIYSQKVKLPKNSPSYADQASLQGLLELLDKTVRYQRHYKELNGRYAREFSQLGLPRTLASGPTLEVLKAFEITFADIGASGFVLRAMKKQGGDQIFIDQNFQLRSNLILPPLSRAYLKEEALRLRQPGISWESLGLAKQYWKIEVHTESEKKIFGVLAPVENEDGVHLVESEVRENRVLASASAESETIATTVTSGSESEIKEVLLQARYAEFIYYKEWGRFTNRWDELDRITGFGFKGLTKSKYLRFHPIEINENDFSLKIESAEGENLGEQYLVARSGNVQQIKYTDALVHQIKETTDLLQNSFFFQVQPEQPANR